MEVTKLIKMLLAFALVALAAAQCDSSCTKIAGDCAEALGHDNTNAVVPIDMYSCLDVLCGTWGEKCGDCAPCKDWQKAEISTSSALGVKPTTLVTSVVTEESSILMIESLTTEASTTKIPESSTIKTTRTPKSSITKFTSEYTTAKHSPTKTKKQSTKKHSTKKQSTTATQTTMSCTSTSRSTHSPPPTFAPRSPTSFDEFDPLNICESKGEGMFNSCRDHNKDSPVPTFCKNRICHTYQHLCADCPLCYRDGPTTWPTQTPTTSTPPPPPATPIPAPSSPPEPLARRDDPTKCGFGCNINECALVCMPQSYIDSYRKYPGNQWFDNNGAEVSVTLRSGVWKCVASGCTLVSKTGECWTWCDQYGTNCQLMCKGKKKKEVDEKMKRGDCWEVCDPEGRHCSVTCNAEKRQCREVCDEAGECKSECVDQPKETCWQACDAQGENCREECSVVGYAE